MIARCIEWVQMGQCYQTAYVLEGDERPRCYYHKKLKKGMISSPEDYGIDDE